MSTLGYFLTFSTYGTWLHGSEKGSVDRAHNTYREAIIAPNSALEVFRRRTMNQQPYVLDEQARKIVLNSIHAHTAFRSWHLWAAHVRTNHVHIVVGIDETKSPDRMMTELKAHALRDINAVRSESECKHWTRHGSTRYLHTEDELNRAIYYTAYEQGEPMELYIDPSRAQNPPNAQSRARK